MVPFFISLPVHPPLLPLTVILPPVIFSPVCMPMLPLTTISPVFMPWPTRLTLLTFAVYGDVWCFSWGFFDFEEVANVKFRLPSVRGIFAISATLLPAKFSGVMQGAWIGTSNALRGVRVIMFRHLPLCLICLKP